MDGLVLEGVGLLRAESVATIPALASTYAAARAGEQGPDAILQNKPALYWLKAVAEAKGFTTVCNPLEVFAGD